MDFIFLSKENPKLNGNCGSIWDFSSSPYTDRTVFIYIFLAPFVATVHSSKKKTYHFLFYTLSSFLFLFLFENQNIFLKKMYYLFYCINYLLFTYLLKKVQYFTFPPNINNYLLLGRLEGKKNTSSNNFCFCLFFCFFVFFLIEKKKKTLSNMDQIDR